MTSAKVRYKYGTNSQRPSVTTNEVLSVEGKTESAVLAALRRKHPNREIIILSVEFK
jgi:hypothetical protein